MVHCTGRWMDGQMDSQVTRWRVYGWMERWTGRRLDRWLMAFPARQTDKLAPPAPQSCPGHSPTCPGPTKPSPAASSAGGRPEEEEEAAAVEEAAGSPQRSRGGRRGDIRGKENISSSEGESPPRSATLEEMLFVCCPLAPPPNPRNVPIQRGAAPPLAPAATEIRRAAAPLSSRGDGGISMGQSRCRAPSPAKGQPRGHGGRHRVLLAVPRACQVPWQRRPRPREPGSPMGALHKRDAAGRAALPAPLPAPGFRRPQPRRPWATPGAPHGSWHWAAALLPRQPPWVLLGSGAEPCCPVCPTRPAPQRGEGCERMDGRTDRASSGAVPSAAAGHSPQPCWDAPYLPGFHLPPSRAGCWARAAALPVMGHGCPTGVPVPGCPLRIRLLGQPRPFSVQPAWWVPGGKTRVTQSGPFQEATSWGSGDSSAAGAGANGGTAASLGWTHQDSLEELNRRTTPPPGWHHFLPPGQLIGPGARLHFSLPFCWVRVPPSEVGANGRPLKGSFPLAERLRKSLARPAAPRRTALPRPCGATGGPWACWQVGARPRPATALSLARRAAAVGPAWGVSGQGCPQPCRGAVTSQRRRRGGRGHSPPLQPQGWAPRGGILLSPGEKGCWEEGRQEGTWFGGGLGTDGGGSGVSLLARVLPPTQAPTHPPQRGRAGCWVLVQRHIWR